MWACLLISLVSHRSVNLSVGLAIKHVGDKDRYTRKREGIMYNKLDQNTRHWTIAVKMRDTSSSVLSMDTAAD